MGDGECPGGDQRQLAESLESKSLSHEQCPRQPAESLPSGETRCSRSSDTQSTTSLPLSCNRCHHAVQVSQQTLTETFLDFSFFTFDCHGWQFWQSSHHLGLEPRRSHMVQLPGLTWRKFTASPCFPKNVTTPKCLEEKLLVI